MDVLLDIDDITYKDGTGFVADPFLAIAEDTYLFFEVLYHEPREKLIGCARITDSFDCDYIGIAIQEPEFEYSFPYTFNHDSKWFMLPESIHLDESETQLKLYRADDFPLEWSIESEFNVHGADPVVFRWHNDWWLFTKYAGELSVYFSEELTSEKWVEHPVNSETRNSPDRMGGRPVLSGDKLFLMYQDGIHYGERVRCFEVTQLDRTTFEQREIESSPILHGQYSGGWNHLGMHHVDFNWESGYAVVDGHDNSGWKIAITQLNSEYPPPARLTPAPDQFRLKQSLSRKLVKIKNRWRTLRNIPSHWREQGTKKFLHKVRNRVLSRR